MSRYIDDFAGLVKTIFVVIVCAYLAWYLLTQSPIALT